MIKKYNIDIARDLFTNLRLTLLETTYINCDTKMKYKCLDCDYLGEKSLFELKKFNSGCKQCNLKKSSEDKKYNLEFAKEIFLNNGLDLLETEYIDSQTSMKFKCQSCDYHGSNCLNNVYNNKQGCKKCKDEASANKRRFNIEYTKQMFLNKNLDLLEKEYKNSRTSMCYKCLTCNYIGKTALSHIKTRKYGCPECYHKHKSGENHWKWNKNKKELNGQIRIKRSKNWINKYMKNDPLYESWVKSRYEYEIHHEPQIQDWCSYVIEHNLNYNEYIIMNIREIANSRERLSIIPIKIHKSIHKNACYKYDKIKFEQFLIDNDILEKFQLNEEIPICP